MHRVGLEPTTSKRRDLKSRALTISLSMLHLLVPFCINTQIYQFNCCLEQLLILYLILHTRLVFKLIIILIFQFINYNIL